MGIAHIDDVQAFSLEVGHLKGRWSALGRAAGCVGAGANRIEIPAGGWSTPAHEHGRQEEIFYVRSGRGLSWQGGGTTEIGEGDCIVYLAGHGAHTLHALEDLDVLAFGARHGDESPRFPRLGGSLLGNRWVESSPGSADGLPAQFVKEAELGPPDLPTPGPRPPTIANLRDAEPRTEDRPRIGRTRRNLGKAANSMATGLQHVEVMPGKLSTPLHCHTLEEEIFVVLDGDGTLLLGDEEIAVRAGHVVSRPPGTGVAHAFRGGERKLTYLAWGMREPGDACFYPVSNKIAIAGLTFRVEPLDYWDGED